ncbi:restriction endonuclease subunit S [Photobacterium damselae subsp. damselae]|uniref:Restriction endonuclease subunit S n=1 Tax=Photobacterium damselae subsp. damselae TaxID=85581 RepID=A0A850R855_PHODD|nr:restriction endonuclease subunit S [Photobacterium damselae subsp. damselae]
MTVESLITQHIDTWTSAVKTKSTSGRGSSKKLELYGVKKLRELILELAVRGKLVPQDPSDEPASVLLERIAAEKEQLVKEKKIKKTKLLPKLDCGDIPFDVPASWMWVRLGDIGYTQTGGTPKKNNPEHFGSEFPFIKPADITDRDVRYDNEGLSNEGADSLGRIAPSGSVLMVCIGTIGKCQLIKQDCAFNQQINSVTPFLPIGTFIFNALRSSYFGKLAWELSSSTTIAILNKGKWESIPVPLPSISEQHRIVAKVDELMTLCDQLEQQTEASIEAHQLLVTTLLNTLTNSADADELMENWARISEHFDTLFTTEESIDQLKQTILQLAVMGKLVPQDPNDEPASVLLERIAEEKAQLIKEKKIKKQKALPLIADDEKPFDLPDGWEWERIGNISHFIEYGSSQKTVDSLPNGVPVLKMGDIQNGQIILGDHKVMSADVDELPNLYVKNNDVLYNRTNSAELVGKTGIYKGIDDKYSFASYLIRIRCNSNNISPDYLNLSMNTPLFRLTQIEPHIKKQCGQANVNGTLMKSMLISIPPLEEQKQVFLKVNELIGVCEKLKERIKISRTTQLHLTDTLVEQVL